ncbi:MAG: hypothetical protein QXN05_02240 [Acidilobaceae archaeon]
MNDDEKKLKVSVLLLSCMCTKYSGLYLRLEMISNMKCGCNLARALITKPECFRDSLFRFCDGNKACIEHILGDIIKSALSQLEGIDITELDSDRLIKIFLEDPKTFLTALLKTIDC